MIKLKTCNISWSYQEILLGLVGCWVWWVVGFGGGICYKLKILLSPQQVKKSSETAKERVETLINFYKDL